MIDWRLTEIQYQAGAIRRALEILNDGSKRNPANISAIKNTIQVSSRVLVVQSDLLARDLKKDRLI